MIKNVYRFIIVITVCFRYWCLQCAHIKQIREELTKHSFCNLEFY